MPVRDGGAALGQCLEALTRWRPEGWKIVVVDDGSVDGSAGLAERHGATVVRTQRARGPAAARNAGAAAAVGEWLCFVDADCVVHRDALPRALALLAQDPNIDALFGSYDDAPAADGVVSQFKNLHHHFVHQHAPATVATFWTGLGLVRRSVFEKAGGFDADRYERPSVEDIDLGYRMSQMGARIHVAPSVQCTHLKGWTLGSMVRSDLWDRGVPWVRLLYRHRVLSADLNLRYTSRLSVLVLYGAGAALVLGPRVRRGVVAAVGAGILTAMNQGLYRFLLRARGPWFTARAIPLHWGYYALNGAAVLLALVPSRRSRRRHR